MTTKKLKPETKLHGRPTLYKIEYDQMIVEHLANGFSMESFAGTIDVCRDTLYEWKEKHPSFSYSIKKGMMKSLLHWEKIGQAGTLGKIKGFNPATYIFTMKNRFAWADKIQTEFSGSVDTTPQVVITMPDNKRSAKSDGK